MHRIGTVSQAARLDGLVPREVFREVMRIVTVLDEAYGAERDIYRDDGGFVFIAEDTDDLTYFKAHHFDPMCGSQEDVKVIQADGIRYLDFFFLCNNEYSINLLIPASLVS